MPKTKPTQDPDRAIARFLAANSRVRAGIEHQRERILATEKALPRLLRGTLHEVTDYTGSFANDIDYYVYELGRLLDLVQDEAFVVFSQPNADINDGSQPLRMPPPELVEARDAFLEAVPNLKETRNALTHFDDSVRLDDFGSFSAAVRFLADGDVEYLVDPRYSDHEAALALSDALFAFLRRILRESIAEDPAARLDEQIRRRVEVDPEPADQ